MPVSTGNFVELVFGNELACGDGCCEGLLTSMGVEVSLLVHELLRDLLM